MSTPFSRPLQLALICAVCTGLVFTAYFSAITGHGFASEAAAALTAEAFRLAHVEHVEIRCDPANEPSMRVPERLGYRARPAIVREDDADARRRGEVVVWDLDRASVRRA